MTDRARPIPGFASRGSQQATVGETRFQPDTIERFNNGYFVASFDENLGAAKSLKPATDDNYFQFSRTPGIDLRPFDVDILSPPGLNVRDNRESLPPV